MANASGYLFVLLTIVLTVFGQITIKWQVAKAGSLPIGLLERLNFISHLLLNPWILIALFAAFLAAVSWMVAMTKFDLSHAYPFMSLSFLLVLVMSNIFFSETVTSYKVIGLIFVVLGIIIGSQG